MSRVGTEEKRNGRAIRNTIVACRLPEDFKRRMTDYATEKDISLSQLIRRGVRMLMETDPITPSPFPIA